MIKKFIKIEISSFGERISIADLFKREDLDSFIILLFLSAFETPLVIIINSLKLCKKNIVDLVEKRNRKSIDEILSYDDSNKVIREIMLRLLEKKYNEGLENFSHPEYVFWIIDSLGAFFYTNGFEGFYTDIDGDYAAEIPKCLEEIEAPVYANIFSKANNRFPNGAPPKDMFTRMTLYDELFSTNDPIWRDLETQLRESGENIDDLLVKFVIENKDNFNI